MRLLLKRQELWAAVPKQGFGEYWGIERLIDAAKSIDCNNFLQIFGGCRSSFFGELSSRSLSIPKVLHFEDLATKKELKFSIDEELLEYYESLESILLLNQQ